jgi:hypothetical protein
VGDVIHFEDSLLDEFNADGFGPTFFILSDGVEGELAFGRESDFRHIHRGPHVVLLDKTGISVGATFPEYRPSPAEQVERLRRLISWFWHDLFHHFITPLARDQLWTAIGTLEDLRRTCVDLARFAVDFTIAAEGYEKVEHALPLDRLAALERTFCPPDRGALLRSARTIVAFYREVAPPMARAHGITYPAALDRTVTARLDELFGTAVESEN